MKAPGVPQDARTGAGWRKGRITPSDALRPHSIVVTRVIGVVPPVESILVFVVAPALAPVVGVVAIVRVACRYGGPQAGALSGVGMMAAAVGDFHGVASTSSSQMKISLPTMMGSPDPV
jgi:hypothetical protein